MLSKSYIFIGISIIFEYFLLLKIIKSEQVSEQRYLQVNSSNINTTNSTNVTNSTSNQTVFIIQNVFKDANVTTPPFYAAEIERVTLNNTIFVKYDICKDVQENDKKNYYNVRGTCSDRCPVGFREISQLNYCYRCNDYTKYFYRGECDYKSCPNNTLVEESTKVCKECSWDKKYFYEKQCWNKCNHFLAVNETENVCVNCKNEPTALNMYNYETNKCVSNNTSNWPEGFGILNRKFNVISYCNKIGKTAFSTTRICLKKCYVLASVVDLQLGIICYAVYFKGKIFAYDLNDRSQGKSLYVSPCPKYTIESASRCDDICKTTGQVYYKNFTLVNETIKCLNQTIYKTEDINISTNTTSNITISRNLQNNQTSNSSLVPVSNITCIANETNENYIIKNETGSFVDVKKTTDFLISRFSCIDYTKCESPIVVDYKVCLWNITEFCHTSEICGLESTCSMVNTKEYICHCNPGKEAYGFNCRFTASQFIDAKIKITSVMQKLANITVISNIPFTLIKEIEGILPLINNFPSMHYKIYHDYFFVKKIISYFDQIYVSSKKDLSDQEIQDLNTLIPNLVNTCIFIIKTMTNQIKSKDLEIYNNVIFLMEMINYLNLKNIINEENNESLNELYYKFKILNNTNYFGFILNQNSLNRHYLYREFYDIVDFDNCLILNKSKYLIVFLEMKIDFTNSFKHLINKKVDLISNPYFVSLLNVDTKKYESLNCPIKILSTLKENEKVLPILKQNTTLRMIKELSINPLNLDDEFFTSDCYYYENNGTFVNMTINDRIKYYYKNLTLKIGVMDIRNKTFYDCDMEYIEIDNSFKYADKFFFTCDKILASGWYFYYYTITHYDDYHPLQTISSQIKCFSKGLNFPDILNSIWFYIVNAIILVEISSLITYFLTYERTFEVNFLNIFFYDLDYYYYHLLPAMMIKNSKIEKDINYDLYEKSSEDDFRQ